MLQIQLTSVTREEVRTPGYLGWRHPSRRGRSRGQSTDRGPLAQPSDPGIEYIVVEAIGCGSPAMLSSMRTHRHSNEPSSACCPFAWGLRRTQGDDEWVWGNSCVRNRWVSSCHSRSRTHGRHRYHKRVQVRYPADCHINSPVVGAASTHGGITAQPSALGSFPLSFSLRVPADACSLCPPAPPLRDKDVQYAASASAKPLAIPIAGLPASCQLFSPSLVIIVATALFVSICGPLLPIANRGLGNGTRSCAQLGGAASWG